MKKILIVIGALLLLSANVQGQDLYYENFESTTNNALPVGWQSAADPGAVWKTGKLPDMLAIGCINAFEHTRYAGLKVDTAYQAAARMDILTLPPISLQTSTTYSLLTLQTDIFYNGMSDTCELQASYNNGSTWTHVQYITPTFWQTKFYILPTASNVSTLMVRFVHKTAAGGTYCGVYIDDIHVYVPQNTDASVYSITPVADSIHNYAGPAQGSTITATVLNRALSQLNDVVVKYKLGNGAVQSASATNLNLAWGEKSTISFPVPCPAPVMGANALNVWVETMGDGDHSNDTFKSTILGAAFMPVKKPVIEERGGTWCGWCVRGLFYCDSLKEVHGDDASIISIHNGDPMTIQPYDNYIGTMTVHGVYIPVYGFPITIYDRRYVEDPMNIFQMYDRYKQYFGTGDITINDPQVNGNQVSIDVDLKPAIDMQGNYRIGLLITEDSVHKIDPGYFQTNTYSYQMQNIPFFGFEALPMFIPDSEMYYNHVARVFMDDPGGTAGSLPTSMNYNNTYSHTFNVTLDTSWNYHFLNAIAMLIRESDTFILNSNHRRLETPQSVISKGKGANEMIVYPNPASNVVYVSYAAQKAGNVTLKLIDMMGRIVYNKNYGTVAADKQSFTVPVNGLPAGIYNLQLETEAGTTSKKINIIQ